MSTNPFGSGFGASKGPDGSSSSGAASASAGGGFGFGGGSGAQASSATPAVTGGGFGAGGFGAPKKEEGGVNQKKDDAAPTTSGSTGFGGFGGGSVGSAAPATAAASNKTSTNPPAAAGGGFFGGGAATKKSDDSLSIGSSSVASSKPPAATTAAGFGKSAAPAPVAAKGFGGAATTTSTTTTGGSAALLPSQATKPLAPSSAAVAQQQQQQKEDSSDDDIVIAGVSLNTVPQTKDVLTVVRDMYEIYRDSNLAQWKAMLEGASSPAVAAAVQRPRLFYATEANKVLQWFMESTPFPADIGAQVLSLACVPLELGNDISQSHLASPMVLQWVSKIHEDPEADEEIFSFLRELDSTESNFDNLDSLKIVYKRLWINFWTGQFPKVGEMVTLCFNIARRFSRVEPIVEHLIQDITQLLVSPCHPQNAQELSAWRAQARHLFGEAKQILPPRDDETADEEREEMSSLRDLLWDIIQMCTGDSTLTPRFILDSYALTPIEALGAHCALIEPNATLPQLSAVMEKYILQWREVLKSTRRAALPEENFTVAITAALIKVTDLQDLTTACDTILKEAKKVQDSVFSLDDDGSERMFGLRLVTAILSSLCSPFDKIGEQKMQKAVFMRNDMVYDFISSFASPAALNNSKSGDPSSSFALWLTGLRFVAFSPLLDPKKISKIIEAAKSHFSSESTGIEQLLPEMESFVQAITTYFDPSRKHQKAIREELRRRTNVHSTETTLKPYFDSLDYCVSISTHNVLVAIADRFRKAGQLAQAISVLQHPLSTRIEPHMGSLWGTAAPTPIGLLSSVAATPASSSSQQQLYGDVKRVMNLILKEIFVGVGEEKNPRRAYDVAGDSQSSNNVGAGSTVEMSFLAGISQQAATGGAKLAPDSTGAASLLSCGLISSEEYVSDQALSNYQLPDGALQIGEALRCGLIELPESESSSSSSAAQQTNNYNNVFGLGAVGLGGADGSATGTSVDCAAALKLCGSLYDTAVAAGALEEARQPISADTSAMAITVHSKALFNAKKRLFAALVSSIGNCATVKVPSILVLYLCQSALDLLISTEEEMEMQRSVVAVGGEENSSSSSTYTTPMSSMNQLVTINAQLQSVPWEASPQRELLSQKMMKVFRTNNLRPSMEF